MDFIEIFIKDWRWVRGLTYEFIKMIPTEKLMFSPHKDFGSLGRQLRHVADIQECYLKGFINGELDFKNRRRDRSMEHNQKKLLKFFEDLDEKLYKFLSTHTEKELDNVIIWNVWENLPNPTIKECLLYLIEHEVYHQGIWTLYGKLGNFETPKFF